jgi:hypothetical protein
MGVELRLGSRVEAKLWNRDGAAGQLAGGDRARPQVDRREPAALQGVVSNVGAIHLVVGDVVREDCVRAAEGDGSATTQEEKEAQGRDYVGIGPAVADRAHGFLLGSELTRP